MFGAWKNGYTITRYEQSIELRGYSSARPDKLFIDNQRQSIGMLMRKTYYILKKILKSLKTLFKKKDNWISEKLKFSSTNIDWTGSFFLQKILWRFKFCRKYLWCYDLWWYESTSYWYRITLWDTWTSLCEVRCSVLSAAVAAH